MTVEIELKLSIDPQSASRISKLPIVRKHAQGRSQRLHLINSYYDTPNKELVNRGVALRIRQIGKAWLQTVKTTGSGSVGIYQRNEWEWKIPNQNLCLALCDAEPLLAQTFSENNLRSALQPLFSTDFWRTTWLLVFADGSQIELAYDYGEIIAQDQHVPICELELELKQGKPQYIYKVALALAKKLGVRLEDNSKAARGYALIAPQTPVKFSPCKAKPSAVQRTQTVEQVFQTIVQQCLEHLHNNSGSVIHCENYEGIHQMRVAVRRLRSCFNLFRPVIPRLITDDLSKKLSEFADGLGKARDWDVLINRTLQPLAKYLPNVTALQIMITNAHNLRAANYQKAHTRLVASSYTQLLLEISYWNSNREWRNLLTAEQIQELDRAIELIASQILMRNYERLKTMGDKFLELSVTQRHRLRILCKRLRYAGEFFANLYVDSNAKNYLRALAKIQDLLGIMNDAAVSQQLCEGLVSADDLGLQLMQSWNAAITECAINNFNDAWKNFCAQPNFWE